MKDDIVLTTKLVGDIEGEFFVPSYQRGYRWEEFEVKHLLEDIYQNGNESQSGNRNYCLQPIVIKKRNDSSYELIDGQQRLTTLYLIYKYMRNVNSFYSDPTFSLTYETRERSEEFLRDIDFERREECIDFWYICKAYETIEEWFSADLQIRVTNIFKYLKENVRVIWYEVGESEDAITLFTRLNIGKIPLTSSELTKAMFLCRDSNGQIDKRLQNVISLQWDNIERELHEPSLWYFLTNEKEGSYQTKIDLVLDLMSHKDNRIHEKYYTFYYFDKLRKTESIESIWLKVQSSFLILKDWFNDHTLYHKIGYLIASKTNTIEQIFDHSKNKTKSEFRELLDDWIKQSIDFDTPYNELSYESSQDYSQITRLLLLFNVESVRKNGERTQWFPFDKYKITGDNEETWSLEHIHAQQSEGMTKQEAWKEWLRLHLSSINAVCKDNDVLIERIETAINAPALQRSEFEILQAEVIDLLSENGSTSYMHSVSNLALLNTRTNTALSNSTFDVKRNVIIDRDKNGQFIPFCTKMVFLKYYTPSDSNQLHFWGQADRKAYIEAINHVLCNYLNSPIEFDWE